MSNKFWKPDNATRAALSRNNAKSRESGQYNEFLDMTDDEFSSHIRKIGQRERFLLEHSSKISGDQYSLLREYMWEIHE